MPKIICKNCKAPIDENATFCPYCGISTGKKKEEIVHEVKTEEISNQRSFNDDVFCPKCGSKNIHFVNKTQGGRDFSVSNACCGTILFGPIGLLCGMGKKQKAETV